MSPEVKKRITELVLLHLMFTTEEGSGWCFHTRDPQEWQHYLWSRRN